MNELANDLQLLNNLIINKPLEVLRVLEQNSIKVPSRPTLSILTKLTLINLPNKKFEDDISRAILDRGESGFIFTAISLGIGVASIFTSSAQAKKQREAQMKIKQMELQQAEQLGLAQIQANKELGRLDIIGNSILEYAKALQSESTKRQKDTGLFIGIIGVGLAVIYSAVQIFKN
jgi:hypothetical protein